MVYKACNGAKQIQNRTNLEQALKYFYGSLKRINQAIFDQHEFRNSNEFKKAVSLLRTSFLKATII